MNDRFKFRVWDKYTHETPAEQMQFLCFNGCLVDSDGCHHSPDDYIVEQYTGLKDKNGNLIYENDVLLCDRKDVECATGAEIHYKSSGVVQREKNGKYFIIGEDWYGSDITFYNECAEIIGNIHETKE